MSRSSASPAFCDCTQLAFASHGLDWPMAGSMDSSDPALAPLPVTVSRLDRVFPTLTAEQLSRISAHGRRRSTTRGEVLVEVGDNAVPVFVVISGELQALRPAERGDTLIVRHQPGQFTGETNMISGRPALARLVSAKRAR